MSGPPGGVVIPVDKPRLLFQLLPASALILACRIGIHCSTESETAQEGTPMRTNQAFNRNPGLRRGVLSVSIDNRE